MSEEREQRLRDDKVIHEIISEWCGEGTIGVMRQKIVEYIATVRQEERRVALSHLSDTIDNFRASGRNLTLWCTPRAVVVQITLHDEDASPDIDRSFSSFREAVTFALEAAAK